MDRNVQRLLNRISLYVAVVATVALLHLFSHSSLSCHPSSNPKLSPSQPLQSLTLSATPFPRSSCSASSRDIITPDRRLAKLLPSAAWRSRAAASSAVFNRLRRLNLLHNASRVLIAGAGAGHAVAALRGAGVVDVTGVDLVDFPPLVRRADPHNLPFFNGVFDLAFTDGIETALFPTRFAAEMERTVRRGGTVAVAVELERWRSLEEAVVKIKSLFRKSSLLEVSNITLAGTEMNTVVMANNGNHP